MTQYFFDFRSGDLVSVDDEGQELANIDMVHREAVEARADALQDFVTEGCLNQHIAINVRDQVGLVLEVSAIL